jgi:putative transposase
MQGSWKDLSMERMCRLARVSRAGFYRWLEKLHGVQRDAQMETKLRSAMQQIITQHRRRYGYRRVTAELQHQGFQVNGKRVLRMMQEDNLLVLRQRKFVVTTQARHGLKVYPNLARRMELTGINQLWVADITYVRLLTEFIYLAVVLDVFSRKVVGWALGRNLTRELTLAALQLALARRQPLPGLVHHSDRGVQYACSDYVQLLQQHQAVMSMSRAGNPYDNAFCESLIKTLKQEEIDLSQYRDFDHALTNIGSFIEDYYNRYRLHSALGYHSPEEFERALPAAPAFGVCRAASMSFLGHGEIYQCYGEQSQDCSPTHSLDESPAGYSWAGCSPAEPACASPAAEIIQRRVPFE